MAFEELKKHPLDDQWHRDRSSDFSKVEIPFLSCANWGGQGIHPRGNFNGFIEAPSKEKWLEAHGIEHEIGSEVRDKCLRQNRIRCRQST